MVSCRVAIWRPFLLIGASRCHRRSARSSLDVSRLKVLAAGDEQPFATYVLELLASGDRLAREAALDALLERPLPRLREQLRALYFELDRDGEKRDPGAHLRTRIARLLLAASKTSRDVDIALRAGDTSRSDGRRRHRQSPRARPPADRRRPTPICSRTSPPSTSTTRARSRPSRRTPRSSCSPPRARSRRLPVARLRRPHDPALVEAAVELLADAPAAVMSRCLAQLTRDAHRADRMSRCSRSSPKRSSSASSKTPTPRSPSIMQSRDQQGAATATSRCSSPPRTARRCSRSSNEQLEHDIRRRPAILDALRVRTTPEQAAILALGRRRRTRRQPPEPLARLESRASSSPSLD